MMIPLKTIGAFIICLILTQTTYAQTENMNFEFGNFNNWILDTGTRPNTTDIDWNERPADDLNVQIELTGPATERFDPNGLSCTPTPLNVPTVFPGGAFSARIGNIEGGRRAARISRSFTVTANEAFLQYSYAIILEDPSHSQEEQPKFVVNIKDASGNLVTCGQFEAFAGPNAASKGFVNCELFNYQILPWTTAGADLTPFIGQQITIEFIALDCTLGAHGGYAYVEATLQPLEIHVENLCIANNAVVGDIVLTAPLGFTSYLWSSGETTQSITVQNAQLGDSFSVDLISNTGCNSSASITLAPVPAATIDSIPNLEICQGGTATLQPTGENAGDFRFTIPDPNAPGAFIDVVPPGNAAVLRPTEDTVYTIIARDNNGCDGPSTTFTVTVIPSNEPPVPTANFDIEQIITQNATPCNTIQLINRSGYCRGGLTYLWDFGDGSPTSTEANPTHTFPLTTDPERYIITLTITAQDDTTDATSLEYTTSSITPQYVALAPNCGTVTFRNISDICNTAIGNFPAYRYTWDFGDGSSTVTTDHTQPTITHTYTSSGMYTTTLSLSDASNPALSIPAFQGDPVAITVDTNANFNAFPDCFDVRFEDLSTSCDPIVSYSWDFGDESPLVTAQNPTHTYTNAGSYNVTLTINNGAVDILHTASVTIAPETITPNFDFVTDCNTVTFRDLSNSCSPLTYQWSFGDGTPIESSQNPTHTYAPNNSYIVTLTINDGNQDFTKTNSITLVSALVFELPLGLEACANPDFPDEASFNLLAQTDHILQNINPNIPRFPTVSFHRSGSDAANAIDPLQTEFSNETNPQTLFARVEDDEGCPQTFPFSLTVFNPPIVNPVEDLFLCYLKENTIGYDLSQLNARVFDGLDETAIVLSYHLDENDALQGSNSVTTIRLSAGVDTPIYIRAENVLASTCFTISSFLIRMDNETTDENDRCMPFFANTMTPNGDGANDVFFIRNIETFPNNELTIYNRWGTIVYETNSYNNTWTGTHKGEPLPVGNYYYIMKLNDNDDRSHSGYITILR